MEAIPVAVRRRIITLYERGQETRQIATALGYCPAAVRRVRQHLRERGTLVPQTHRCGRKGHFTPERREHLRQLVAQRPDATLAELAQKMSQTGVAVAVSTVDEWLAKLGLTFKKSPSTPPSRTGRMSRRSAGTGTPRWPR